MEPILKLEHIQKYYGNEGNITKAIRDISFSVEAGEFLGIMGASGSGKTTLLNCISTIDTVSAGHIYLGGTDVTEIKPKAIARFRRENLGFVFQDFNLLDTLTISENIALALSINKTPARDVEPRIQDIAQKLNITDILNKYPYQVSGGQKQRCACARAIINNPKLLLADEPTGALDSHSAQMLLSTIQSINEQLSATILMVTHDAFTASYASRILFLQDGAIFTELRKGNDSRSTFFEKILNVLTMIGGGQSHVSGTAKRKEAFTTAEVAHLMKVLPDDRMGLSIRLLLGTGMRMQELLALEPQFIEEDGSVIHIRQAVKVIKGTVSIGSPKSKDSIRDIPVPLNVRPCAIKLRDTTDQFIWESPKTGLPCNPTHFRDVFRKSLEEAGDVRLLTPHSCRHTYVSQMQALGVDIQTIQSIVGHADTEMTEHYLHVQESIRQSAIQLFSEAFSA